MTHLGFIYTYDGKHIDRSGQGRNQCMDLANQYVCEVFGYPVDQYSPIGAPTAYQSFLNGDPDFIKIEGNDISQFQEGDIIYWDLSLGNKAGHVAIFLCQGERSDLFESFDQNWPEGSKCHQQSHSTASVCGVLRHKSMVKQTEQIQEINYKENMQLFKQAQQMIWTKINGVPQYWIMWLREDGKEVKREVKEHKNRCQDIFSAAGKYHKWETADQLAMLVQFEQGADFDINVILDNHPELLEQ